MQQQRLTIRRPTLVAAKAAVEATVAEQAARGFDVNRMRATREPDGTVAYTLWLGRTEE